MPESIGTGFLVASPMLLDPNFRNTVVLLVEHTEEGGSLGFVINRPAPVSFQDVADELGLGELGSEVPHLPVLSGGPVAPETGWLVFDGAAARAAPDLPQEILKVSDHLYVSTSLELLGSLAKSDEARAARHLLMLGCAGWAPGQLEDEIKDGTWIPVDYDPRLLFETDPVDQWFKALRQIGIDPNLIVGGPPALA